MDRPDHSTSTNTRTAASVTPPDEPPKSRLRLKPDRRPSGAVDGAWWPQSRALAEELPDLVTRLHERIGPTARVAYSLITWPAAQRRLTIDDHIVRLGGFLSTPPDVVDLFGDRGRVCLLVISPETTPKDAQLILSRAASIGNEDDVETLMNPQQWESDGHRVSALIHWEGDCGSASSQINHQHQ
jgi:hypothetical protein